jgi:hypothetical protein
MNRLQSPHPPALKPIDHPPVMGEVVGFELLEFGLVPGCVQTGLSCYPDVLVIEGLIRPE